MNQNQIEAVRNVLRKYLLPDCLKPEYDGMNTQELAQLIIKAYEAQPKQ